MNHGFVKVAAAVPSVRVASCKYNTERIQSLIFQAQAQGAEIVSFPELSLTGYTCGDLFGQQLLLDEAEAQLTSLLNATRTLDIISIVGLPVAYAGVLLNCAAVLQRGKILGLVPKTYLPNYHEFYERRWFASALDVPEGQTLLCGQQARLSARQMFRTPTCTFAIEICEDLWAPVPPSSALALQGAEIIFNLSAGNDLAGKRDYLQALAGQQSARCLAGYVYSGCGFGESTQDLVFGGKTLLYENGTLLAASPAHTLEEQLTASEIDVERLRAERRTNTTFGANAARLRETPPTLTETAPIPPKAFTLTRPIPPHPFIPQGPELDRRCAEILAIQSEGLAARVRHTGCETLIIGISGGLDSTLALLVCAQAFDRLGKDRRGITGITMPGFGTTGRTHTNALQLMRRIGVSTREISITEACRQHLRDLGHAPALRDATYENAQARERTQILMDAANQTNGLVVGTGDLSELALGWATYNGDHMSMYGVNASVPKTLVRHLVRWAAHKEQDPEMSRILLDIADTPISPELIPADEAGHITQKTEDLVGPYELHDFFLYYTLRWGFRPAKIHMLARRAFEGAYTSETIRHWLTTFFRRFFAQQFKRSCLPDGPKVGSCSLSPRGDWRMPSDASSQAWLDECAAL